MVKKNPDFRFNRMRKSGKTEFFEVHIKRAVITQLENSVVRHIPHFLATCAHAQLQITPSIQSCLKLQMSTESLKSMLTILFYQTI